jgi:hypothetical protein
LTLQWREEHGNTFAPEIERSIRLRWHSAKRGRNYREIRAEKNSAHRFHPVSGGQIPLAANRQMPPHTANIKQAIDSQIISRIFEVVN